MNAETPLVIRIPETIIEPKYIVKSEFDSRSFINDLSGSVNNPADALAIAEAFRWLWIRRLSVTMQITTSEAIKSQLRSDYEVDDLEVHLNALSSGAGFLHVSNESWFADSKMEDYALNYDNKVPLHGFQVLRRDSVPEEKDGENISCTPLSHRWVFQILKVGSDTEVLQSEGSVDIDVFLDALGENRVVLSSVPDSSGGIRKFTDTETVFQPPFIRQAVEARRGDGAVMIPESQALVAA